MSMKWTEDEIKILQTYYLDHSAEECIKKFNLDRNPKALQKKARELGIDKHFTWTEDEEQKVRELWPEATMKELLKAIPRHNYNSIMLKAKELGVKSKDFRKRIGSLKFLDKLTTRSTYWWGFIMADGTLTPRGELLVSISSKDKDFLQVLQNHLQCNLHIRKTNKSSYPNASDQVYLYVQDAKFKKKWYQLLNYINPKTYNPPDLSIFYIPDLLVYFLIGFIDGDGCIWRNGYSETRKGSINLRIELHSSWEQTLRKLCTKVEEFYDIHFNVKLNKRGFAQATIASQQDLFKLYKFVNKKDCDFMERKWDRVKAFMSQ